MAIYQGTKKLAYSCNVDNSAYSVPIGTILSYASATPPVGFLVCDGSEVSKTTYADLYTIIGDTYGTSTDASKFKLPDLRDKFVQGANGNLGTSKKAGLPDLTGELGYIKSIRDGSYWQGININTGVFKSSIQTVNTSPAATTAQETESNFTPPSTIVFKASDSNSIYGNSNTVQPPSICLLFIIKALKVSDVYTDSADVIDDHSVSTDTTYSSKKIKDCTLPFYLIDTSADIDFNQYYQTGYYTPNISFSTGEFTHSILNAPTSGWLPAGGFALEIKNFSDDWSTQILYSYVNSDNNSAPIYTRTFFYDNQGKSVFTDWKRLADIDDNSVSTGETWSSKKMNDMLAKSFDKRIILSYDRAAGQAAKSAQLNSKNGAYLYWSSVAGQERYSIGLIVYILSGWQVIPIKEADSGTTISFSIDGNVLTMVRNSSNYPAAGGVIALGADL